jgi:beta-lactamase superfamily II metal-dependent hydrolase
MSEENFRIVYFDVGQGDTILVVCPDLKLVMIDCGSAKGLGAEEKESINAEIRLHASRNKNNLDALILTHCDKDHYNQVIQFLYESWYMQGDTKITLDTVTFSDVYFSEKNGRTDCNPLETYKEGAVGSNIRGSLFKTQNLHHVFINKDQHKVLKYSQDNDFSMAEVEDIQNHRLQILHGVTDGGQKWQVSIIAGNVPGANATNPRSLVTLLEIGPNLEYKALFLADGTTETEAFLMATHKDLITNVSFAHVPHHGSDTSSGAEFVRTVNPRGAQTTMQTAESGFCLPKKIQSIRWINQVAEKELHLVDYWEIAEETKVNEELANWRANGLYNKHIKTSGEHNNKYYLQIDKINADFLGYYYLVPERMLWRAQTKQNVWQTGVSGLVEWFLPRNFL